MPLKEKLDAGVLYLKEVRQELKKVTWPKREDVTRATIMTIVACVLISLYLGFTDMVLAYGIQPLYTGSLSIWTLFMFAYFGMLAYLVFLTTKE